MSTSTGNYFYDNLVERRGCYNPEEVLNNLNPIVFGQFLRMIGLTENDAKSFLIKTLNYVNEFDT